MINRKNAEKKHSKKEKIEVAEILEEISAEQLEELKRKAAERDEYYQKWLNVHAEYENTRKRMEKEKYDHIKFANEGIIAQLFPIVDNFDMAFSAMEKADDKAAVMDGISMVQKEFHRILEEYGVSVVETKGKQFDPNVHEAVMAEETDEYEDGAIVEEIRPGYTLNGRLLRPAQVRVAKNEADKG